MEVTPLDGKELVLSHAKTKLRTSSQLSDVEKLGAMAATFASTREQYGPTTLRAPDLPLPEVVKGAIASARG